VDIYEGFVRVVFKIIVFLTTWNIPAVVYVFRTRKSRSPDGFFRSNFIEFFNFLVAITVLIRYNCIVCLFYFCFRISWIHQRLRIHRIPFIADVAVIDWVVDSIMNARMAFYNLLVYLFYHAVTTSTGLNWKKRLVIYRWLCMCHRQNWILGKIKLRQNSFLIRRDFLNKF
jgi:hypothetical protein